MPDAPDPSPSPPAPTPAPVAFSYARGVAPVLWVLVALMAIELLVTHLLLAHWFPRAALAVSAVTLALMLWFAGGVLSFARRPVLVGGTELLLRLGWLKRVAVPIARVRAVRREPIVLAPGDRTILNLALVTHPNIAVELSPPLRRRRGVLGMVAHRLDDPAAFEAAVLAAKERCG